MQPPSDFSHARRTATPPYGGSLSTLSCESGACLTAAELDGACKASRWPMIRLHDSYDHTTLWFLDVREHCCMKPTLDTFTSFCFCPQKCQNGSKPPCHWLSSMLHSELMDTQHPSCLAPAMHHARCQDCEEQRCSLLLLRR